MRYIRLISLLVMLTGSMLSMAQDYVITKTFTEQRCTDDTPYNWRGQVITKSGKYNDTILYADPNYGVQGQIEQLNITFTAHLTYSKHFEIKKGQKVEFRGKTYDKEGTYTDKKPSTTACDTTYTIMITLSEDYHFYEELDICKSDVPYIWRGQQCYYTGEYKKTYRTKDNKNDSVYHLTLNVYTPGEYTKYETVCEDELPYRLGTQEIYESGTYTDTIYQSYGCLDTIHVVLTVVKRPYVKQEVTFCQSEGFKHDTTTYYDRRIFLDTIKRVSGCDSIVETTCIPMPSYRFETRAGHRPGESYTWPYNGQTYTNDTNVYVNLQTATYGCDSIYALYLTTTQETSTNISACEGDTIFYKRYAVSRDTTIHDTLRSVSGGDSVIFVHYTFHPRYYFRERTSLCFGDTIAWGNHTDMKGSQIILKEPGSYFDRKLSQFGCDSVYEIEVTVLPKYNFDTIVVVCNDELPYKWKDVHGVEHEWFKQDVDTILTDTMGHTPITPNEDFLDGDIWYRAYSGGCDSTWQMRLIVKPCGHDTAPLCPSSFVWVNNVKYTTTGDFRQCVQSSIPEVCDSICRVHIYQALPFDKPEIYDTITVCASDNYYWHSQKITQSGVYQDKLKTAEGCDSIIYLHAKVLPAYYLAEPTRNICRGDSTFINGKIIKTNCSFLDTLLTQEGCDSVIRYTVNIVRDFHFDQVDHFPQGGIYWWHNHGDSIMLTEPKVYFDSCKTVDGCDSIYRLTLTWDRPNSTFEYDSICQNDLPYMWHGRIFYSDTVAVDTLSTKSAMDSICTLSLKVLPFYENDQNISLCAGQSYMLKQRPITHSGTYIDSLVADNGCDSIIRYHINFLPTHLIDEKVQLGTGQSYFWEGHNMTVSQPGWYFDSLRTDEGCDSIYRLHVIEDKSFLKGETRIICASDTPYEWHGQLLSASGIYYDRYEIRPGVDSTYYINLTINPTYIIESTVDLCHGGKYSFFGRILTEPGVYEESMTSTKGCDSIYRVTINRLPSYFNDVNFTICQGETIQVADTTVSSACQFTRVYPSKDGCDSTVRYMVQVSMYLYKPDTASLCEGDTYTWKRANRPDTILTKPGSYWDVYKSQSGCDSAVYQLTLNFYRTSIWDTIIYICPDETYIFKGKEYNITQVLSDTVPNQFGCDSIRNFHYKMMTYCTNEDRYLHCFGSSIIIDGRNYTEDGIYRIPLSKDTLHRFVIASHPTYEYSKNIGSFCDSVTYAGTTYYARGEAYSTFTIDRYMQTVQYGCDSIEHVTMSIFKSAHTPTYKHTIDDYAYVIFDGERYSTTGLYTHPYHTIHGCDSTLMLDLTVNATAHPGSLLYQHCALNYDQPLTIFGKKYQPTTDTTILDTIFIPNAPIMIIRTANVEVEEPFRILTLDPEQEICAANELQFNIFFTHTGIVPPYYEFRFLDNDISATPKYQSGEVEPLSKSIRIEMNGQGSCIRPGIYPYELLLKGKRCHLSDTTMTGEVMVRYPASIMEANWTDVVALCNETRNAGGWVLQAPYQWQITGKLGDDKTALVAPADMSQPYLYSEHLENGDKITVTLMREGYRYAIPSCEYTFQSVATNERKPTLITPTMVRKSAFVRLTAQSDGQYRLIDNYGHLCLSGEYHAGEQQIQVPATSGCYIMQVIDNNAAIRTHKIIVY